MNVEEMLAREAIRYTMSVYNTAGDRGRVEELVSAFCQDGVLEVAGVAHHGHDGILAALSPNVNAKKADHAGGARVFLRHNLTTCRIEFRNTDEADSWTYFNVVTPIGFDHCGVYVDHFVREGERWLIKYRKVKIDWRHDNSGFKA